MKLRKATNAGMMDCKHALQEAEGDFDKAVDIIRKKGLVVASKRADREAKEGCALANMPATTEDLLAIQLDGRSIADQISEQTGVIGEKLELSYYGSVKAEDCVIYIHPGNMLATVVGFNKAADTQVKKNIAMQVAAMAPVAVDKDGIPQNVIDHEFEIGREKAREEGKPENMLDKIAQGRLNKFFQESTLLNQVFEQDGKMSVKEYLKSVDKDLTVTAFLRFTLNA